jgi:hypothetical protein
MSLVEINWTPSRKELRQFAGLWLPVFAALAGALVVYRSGNWRAAAAVWVAGAIAGAVGLLRPQLFKPVFLGWMVAAYPIGWTVSTLVLLATYYLVFTPVALLMRLFRYDPLYRRIERARPTYWVEHDQPGDPATYFRQF